MAYHYLVAAALQEELHAFIEFTEQNPRPTTVPGVEEVTVTVGGKSVDIALFTPNKMGMPYNAAAIMEIIDAIQPSYTFFIGTCAGLSGQKIGSVLIPQRAFSYESGKYDNDGFKSDFRSYDFSELLRTQAEAH